MVIEGEGGDAGFFSCECESDASGESEWGREVEGNEEGEGEGE